MASQTSDNLIESSGIDPDSTELNLLEPEGKDKRQCTSKSEYIQFLIEEISEVFKNNESDTKARANLQFYYLVRGGNTSIVREVLEQMENKDKKEELAWLIVGKCKQRETHIMTRLLCVLLFVFCLVLNIILSPICYCIHAVLHNMHAYMRKCLMRNIELPFVYAVMSESKDMIKLFLSYGADILTADSDGNNIYHYLAEMSSENGEKTIRCNDVLASCIENIDGRRAELMTQRNYLNLTAFEAVAKYGSLAFFNSLMESRNSIGRRKMVISEQSVWATTLDTTFNIMSGNLASSTDQTDVPEEKSNEKATVRISEFDMRQFEKGDVFGKQSYPLQLLTGRSVDQLSEVDVTALYKSRIINMWMQAKTRLYAMFCVISQLMNISVSAVLLAFLLMQGGDMIEFPLQTTYFRSYLKLIEDNVTESFSELEQLSLEDVQKLCKGTSQEEARSMVYGSVRTQKEWQDHSKTVDILGKCLIGFVVFQFFADMLVRIMFMCKNFNFRSKTLIHSVLPFVSRWIPGSYAEKQLSVILILPLGVALYMKSVLDNNIIPEINVHIERTFEAMDDEFLNETNNNLRSAITELSDVDAVLQTISVLFMVCLLLRFFHIIHSMRLLPGIGFFIITTKKMSRHLVQFGLVFIIVMLAFSTMFHLTIRIPDCPGVKAEGFSTLTRSAFSTYQASLGHGDFDPFSYNLNSEIAYIACTVIIIIMLLNLIIAVMTTTATDMNLTPWKQVMCMVEMWDEILGIEAQVLCLTQPFRYIRKKCQKLGHKYCKWSIKRKRHVFVVVYYDKD